MAAGCCAGGGAGARPAGGLAALAAAPGTGEPAVDLFTSPLGISGAVVVAVGFPENTSFWIEDANGAIRAYFGDAPLAQDLSPGDIVTFQITELDNYASDVEITGYSNFSVNSTGNTVRVQDGQGLILDYPTRGGRNFDAYGELVTDLGECGPATCWLISNGGTLTPLRLSNAGGSWALGDCIHFVAPLSRFEGEMQYDMFNYDWFEYY